MSFPRTLRLVLLTALALVPVWLWSDPPPAPPPQPLQPNPRPVAPVRPAGSAATVQAPTRLPAAGAPVRGPNTPPGKPGVLSFDSTNRHVDLAEGERTAAFVFAITNISPDEVTISFVNTSCGCTAGRLPSYPWKLQPGEGGHIDVSMDLTGKFGLVTKTATVVSSAGSYVLTVSAKAPPAPVAGAMGDRTRNLSIASADRQAVFRNDCANCHVQPTLGKKGRELYETACGICHEAEHRAQMVPDLRTRLNHTDRNYWAKWIAEGRPGSLMPAFSAKLGGILSDVQVESLVDYLENEYKKDPPPAATAAHAATQPASTPGVPAVVDR